ncbi:carbohydrate ABC transporter permease [Algisphaera agarilytica]|uniref:ABC-type sugar transport system permease subunit n=1 Tax=Algisphaera agarilytica TaxID=1385975 RepID=A0A7X0LJY5_9BACT|nr:sugar ABC transporter permease [Algisphaera agarilytica]MBB6429870.1 ABC-type sugar transport system permease subunit [Algisphaera agarilytica]
MSKKFRSTALMPYLFVAPFVVSFVVFVVYPLGQSVVLAFMQTNGPKTRQFVGLDNFSWLFTQDPDFWKSVLNIILYTAGSMLIQLPASLGLALLLNRKDIKARGFWRMIFFAPILVGLVFVAIIFGLLFAPNNGLINDALYQATLMFDRVIPFYPDGWVFDREFRWTAEYAMPAMIIASFWMYVGFNMIYFLAALQNVSKDLMEAAEVDGAGPWQRFLNVTVPAIRPVGTFVVLLSFIGSVQLFELPYLLVGPDGGPGKKGLTPVMHLFSKGFDAGDLGYASAIGWLIAVVLFGVALLQKKLSNPGTD